MWGISDAKALANVIIGSVSESAGAAALSRKYAGYIRTQATQQKRSVDSITKDLHDELSSSGIQLDSVVMDDIYVKSETGSQNQQVWLNADKIDQQTLSKIQKVS